MAGNLNRVLQMFLYPFTNAFMARHLIGCESEFAQCFDYVMNNRYEMRESGVDENRALSNNLFQSANVKMCN